MAPVLSTTARARAARALPIVTDRKWVAPAPVDPYVIKCADALADALFGTPPTYAAAPLPMGYVAPGAAPVKLAPLTPYVGPQYRANRATAGQSDAPAYVARPLPYTVPTSAEGWHLEGARAMFDAAARRAARWAPAAAFAPSKADGMAPRMRGVALPLALPRYVTPGPLALARMARTVRGNVGPMFDARGQYPRGPLFVGWQDGAPVGMPTSGHALTTWATDEVTSDKGYAVALVDTVQGGRTVTVARMLARGGRAPRDLGATVPTLARYGARYGADAWPDAPADALVDSDYLGADVASTGATVARCHEMHPVTRICTAGHAVDDDTVECHGAPTRWAMARCDAWSMTVPRRVDGATVGAICPRHGVTMTPWPRRGRQGRGYSSTVLALTPGAPGPLTYRRPVALVIGTTFCPPAGPRAVGPFPWWNGGPRGIGPVRPPIVASTERKRTVARVDALVAHYGASIVAHYGAGSAPSAVRPVAKHRPAGVTPRTVSAPFKRAKSAPRDGAPVALPLASDDRAPMPLVRP